jgi:hypothetical protein
MRRQLNSLAWAKQQGAYSWRPGQRLVSFALEVRQRSLICGGSLMGGGFCLR